MFTDWVSVDCIVRDISPGGARLEFLEPVNLPKEFRLYIVSADLTLPAAGVWQRRNEAGIRFTGVGIIGDSESAAVRSAA